MVHDEAERLNNDIQNLLDATRISRGQVKPRLEWIEPLDIVNSALERRRRRLAGHTIAIDMDSNLPFIYVDPVLVEQAFVQVVDNAAKYSPPARRSRWRHDATATTWYSRSTTAAPA